MKYGEKQQKRYDELLNQGIGFVDAQAIVRKEFKGKLTDDAPQQAKETKK